ncbi:MAG: polysaccharide pyruvyl transferase family protein [Clostridiales bacterium]|nr:polysaccharide pyruvyl transferase family protein [Clostridiales bacterium]
MKIGIMTYWKSTCNYGEQLQNYALQKYLRDLGHEPFLICYDYDNDTIRTPFCLRILKAFNPGQLARYSYNRKLIRDGISHPRGFERFRERYLSLSRSYPTIEDLVSDPPEADMYISGSDQVWNTFGGGLTHMKNRIRAFFLDFGNDDTIRASYAASWGRNSIPDDEYGFIKPLLSRFDAVSVRESSGLDICRQLGADDARLATDPVLLHDADVYRQLYSESDAGYSSSKYLFFYYMNNDIDYDRTRVIDWARSKGLEVVYVTDDWHDNITRSFPGVAEWLKLIDNAEYVVTNSYHCVLFSIIFRKRFGVIKRFGEYAGMNTRMDSVFETFEIGSRYIDDSGFDIIEQPLDVTVKDHLRSMCTPKDIVDTSVLKTRNREA